MKGRSLWRIALRVGKEGMTTLFDRHVSWHLSSNGGRAWFEKFQHERGFPEDLTQSIHKALG